MYSSALRASVFWSQSGWVLRSVFRFGLAFGFELALASQFGLAFQFGLASTLGSGFQFGSAFPLATVYWFGLLWASLLGATYWFESASAFRFELASTWLSAYSSLAPTLG